MHYLMGTTSELNTSLNAADMHFLGRRAALRPQFGLELHHSETHLGQKSSRRTWLASHFYLNTSRTSHPTSTSSKSQRDTPWRQRHFVPTLQKPLPALQLRLSRNLRELGGIDGHLVTSNDEGRDRNHFNFSESARQKEALEASEFIDASARVKRPVSPPSDAPSAA